MTEKIWRVGRDLKPIRVKEPNFENLKEGVILIDKSGAKWKIIKVEKGSIPAENKYTLQSLENKDWTLNYKLPGIERYYKIYVGEVQEKPKMTPTRKLLERYEEKLRRGELDDVGKLFLWYLRKKVGVIR